MRYQPPNISGFEDHIRSILRSFVTEALNNPEFVPDAIVHEAVVYVMRHKPADLERVDGDVILPLLQQVVIELAPQFFRPTTPKPPSPPLPQPQQLFVSPPAPLVEKRPSIWRKMLNAVMRKS
jgi:hypothetical protein